MEPIKVSVGVLLRQGKVLIGKRRRGSRYEGMWEFPGGKIEPGEQPHHALVRELREELCISAVHLQLLATREHHYEDGGYFRVWYYLVRSWHGELLPQFWQQAQWVELSQLDFYPIFEPNRCILPLLMQYDGHQ